MELTLPSVPTLAIFAATAIVLVAIPGPNMLFILARGADQGPRAAFAAAIGVEFGTLVYVLVTALGLSALLVTSPMAFNMIKYAGAAYLFYLAISTLCRRPGPTAKTVGDYTVSLARLGGEAAMVNILNPKVALFFLALLPQYIDPSRGSIGAQTLTLGILFFVIALTMDLVYATLSVSLGAWWRTSSSAQIAQRYFSSIVFLALGLYAGFVS